MWWGFPAWVRVGIGPSKMARTMTMKERNDGLDAIGGMVFFIFQCWSDGNM